MSYNIVKKGKSTVLVHKFRDPNNPNKVVEKYLLSMGTQTDARHKEIRSQVNELAQEDRINFCQRSGLVIEVPEDVPRRKVATGDIREQPIKKERTKNFTTCPMCGSSNIKFVDTTTDKKGYGRVDTSLCVDCGALAGFDTSEREKIPKKARKKSIKVEEVKEMVDTRPKKQSVVLKSVKPVGMPVEKYKTLSARKEAVTERITLIKDRIKDQEIYLKHYKSRQGGLSKSEKQMRVDEAERYKTYKIEGRKAIKILRKQRSELRMR